MKGKSKGLNMIIILYKRKSLAYKRTNSARSLGKSLMDNI